MANPNKREAKLERKCRCENCGSVMIFGCDLERRQYLKKTHGPLRYCCCPGYKWTARRMGRVRTNVDNAHRTEASTNNTLHPSEFRTSTSQPSTSSPQHFRTADSTIDPNFAPIPALICNDFTSMSQTHQSQPEAAAHHHRSVSPEYSQITRWAGETADQQPWNEVGAMFHAALEDNEAPHLEYKSVLNSSEASRTRVRVPQQRIFRQCRLRRRRKSRPATSSILSSGLPLAPRGVAPKSAVGYCSNEQDTSTTSTQSTTDPVNVELMASSLCSFNLGYSTRIN